jgi:putative N6-adenine-specific DNA methylase
VGKGRPPHVFHAAAPLGVEEATAAELCALGAVDVRTLRGGVRFLGDETTLCEALLRLRTATRVVRLIAEGPVASPRDLHALAASVDWRFHWRVGQTIACEASVRDSCFNHSGYPALVVKDGMVDRVRAETGSRPDVDAANPDLSIKVLIRGDGASLWRDESGASLHKRGYRGAMVKSPLNEALAAGILLLTDYLGDRPIADPMCGSGVFAIEAALIALRRFPGALRDAFAYRARPDYDAAAFDAARARVLKEAEEAPRPSFVHEGSDRHEGAIALARRDAEAAGVADFCRFVVADAAERRPENDARLVYCNPPYGERLGGDAETDGDSGASWFALGRYLRRLPGATAHVLCGAPDEARRAGMKASRRRPIRNGPIDCRLLTYDVFPEKRGEDAGDAAPPKAAPPI